MFMPSKTGYGAGTKEFADRPNLVRVVIGEAGSKSEIQVPNPLAAPEAQAPVPTRKLQGQLEPQPQPQPVMIGSAHDEPTTTAPSGLLHNSLLCLETNIDDMNPQLFESVIANLFEAGARDAWVTTIVMKKGRPAFTLSALCDDARQTAVLSVFLEQTTTLGVRVQHVDRLSLERRFEPVETNFGQVMVKVGLWGTREVNIHPECALSDPQCLHVAWWLTCDFFWLRYEDCKKLAEENSVPVGTVIDAAKTAYYNKRSS